MKKWVKITIIVICVILAIALIGLGVFIYLHGNTKPYSVPEEVHAAIESQKADKKDGEVRIMSSNLLVSYPGWHSSASREKGIPNARPRAKMYFEILDTYKPDVVGVQEMCDMWFNCLVRSGRPYKFLFPVSTAFTVNMTSMMYNSETTNLIEKGQFAFENGDNSRLRRVVWGLFEDKATGKRYIVTSTHLDLIREGKEEAELKTMQSQIKELIDFSNKMKEQYNVPVFSTGDYNTVNNVENWKELFPETSEEKFAEWDAEKIMNDQAPTIYAELSEKLDDTILLAKEKSFAGVTTETTPVYDHIFMNGDAEISRYSSISGDAMHRMSDHFSIYVDAKLK